jgi:hypothetical protein
MSWSGTSSCHIWNIFLDVQNVDNNIISATANGVSFQSTSSSAGWNSPYYSSYLAIGTSTTTGKGGKSPL